MVACHQLTANRMDIEHGLAADTMKENLLEKVRKMSASSPSYSAAARCKQVSGSLLSL